MDFTDPDAEGRRLLDALRAAERAYGEIRRAAGEEWTAYLGRCYDARVAVRDARRPLFEHVRDNGPAENDTHVARLDGRGVLRVYHQHREAPCSTPSSSPRSSSSPSR